MRGRRLQAWSRVFGVVQRGLPHPPLRGRLQDLDPADLEAGKALETDCLTGASIMRDQTHSSRRGFPGVVDEGAFVAIVLLAVVWLIWLVGPALFLAQ